MASANNAVFVGLRGTVVALDRANGSVLRSTELKGSDFVSIVVDQGDLFAGSKGRLYKLDPATGHIQWSNDLPGLGYGIVSIAGASNAAARAEKKRRDAAAAASVSGSASS